jgi:SWI/SNF-related matrix-associated actin-dependent regulator of chromatin subfamily A3
MMIPLQLLLFSRQPYVQQVGAALERNASFLEHPASYDPGMHGGASYLNPHNPLAGAQEAERRRRELLTGLNGGYSGRLYGGRSVEVQREQVDQISNNIRSGVDLDETEPGMTEHLLVTFFLRVIMLTSQSKRPYRDHLPLSVPKTGALLPNRP